MILEVMAVYDSKAGAYQVPVMVRHLQDFHEAMMDVVNQADHVFHHFPSDYIVFHLGKWNPETGGFALFPEPKNLGSLVRYQHQVKAYEDAVVDYVDQQMKGV